ncbi:MAG: hypothetical protein ACR2KB_15220 [Chitinophagaceae bacterium]
MAINKNHEFEDLNGLKCAIVEKNVSEERTAFLKELLEFNRYTVIVVPSPPPKAVVPPKPVAPPVADATQLQPIPTIEPQPAVPPPVPEPLLPPPPSTFTIGVTDVSFNPINAIFGRLLKTKGGHIVTQAYWYQKEALSLDEIPYYEKKL